MGDGSQPDGPVLGDIRTWLSLQRARYKDAASALQVPLSDVTRVPVREASTSGLVLRYEDRPVSPVKRYRYHQEFQKALGRDLDESGLQLADELAKRFGPQIQYVGLPWSMTVIDYYDEPLPLLEVRGLQAPFECAGDLLKDAALYYVSHLKSLNDDDPALLDSLANDLIAFAAAEEHTILISVPLWGISGAETVTVGNIVLRPISSEEAGYLMATSDHSHEKLPNERFHVRDLGSGAETHVLELRSKSKKASDIDMGFQWRKVLLAFQLTGIKLGGPGFAFAWREPEWVSFGILRSPAEMAPYPGTEPVRVSETDLVEIARISEKIRDSAVRTPTDYRGTAMRRFAMGMGRRLREDAFIDWVICLEGLLLPAGRYHAELRYRFSLNGAVYLENKAENRLTLRKRLAELYDLRSSLVHGGSKGLDHDEVKRAADEAFNLARTGLLKALHEGWPTEDTFMSLILKPGVLSEP